MKMSASGGTMLRSVKPSQYETANKRFGGGAAGGDGGGGDGGGDGGGGDGGGDGGGVTTSGPAAERARAS